LPPSGTMFRDTETMVSTRLKEPWSAVAFAGALKAEVIETVQDRCADMVMRACVLARVEPLLVACSPLSAPPRGTEPTRPHRAPVRSLLTDSPYPTGSGTQ